jgi:hypothetical protein
MAHQISCGFSLNCATWSWSSAAEQSQPVKTCPPLIPRRLKHGDVGRAAHIRDLAVRPVFEASPPGYCLVRLDHPTKPGSNALDLSTGKLVSKIAGSSFAAQRDGHWRSIAGFDLAMRHSSRGRDRRRYQNRRQGHYAAGAWLARPWRGCTDIARQAAVRPRVNQRAQKPSK